MLNKIVKKATSLLSGLSYTLLGVAVGTTPKDTTLIIISLVGIISALIVEGVVEVLEEADKDNTGKE